MSLYLGEGVADLPEVREEIISSPEPGDTSEESIMDKLKVAHWSHRNIVWGCSSLALWDNVKFGKRSFYVRGYYYWVFKKWCYWFKTVRKIIVVYLYVYSCI